MQLTTHTSIARRNELAEPYKWKCNDGRRLTVQEMETKHLFNTIKMIWNHCCPANLQLTPFKQWNLNIEPNYAKHGVQLMLEELATRKDIKPYMLDSLKKMQEGLEQYLNHPHPLLGNGHA